MAQGLVAFLLEADGVDSWLMMMMMMTLLTCIHLFVQ